MCHVPRESVSIEINIQPEDPTIYCLLLISRLGLVRVEIVTLTRCLRQLKMNVQSYLFNAEIMVGMKNAVMAWLSMGLGWHLSMMKCRTR